MIGFYDYTVVVTVLSVLLYGLVLGFALIRLILSKIG